MRRMSFNRYLTYRAVRLSRWFRRQRKRHGPLIVAAAIATVLYFLLSSFMNWLTTMVGPALIHFANSAFGQILLTAVVVVASVAAMVAYVHRKLIGPF